MYRIDLVCLERIELRGGRERVAGQCDVLRVSATTAQTLRFVRCAVVFERSVAVGFIMLSSTSFHEI
jgi:hypothetical protein